MVGAIEGGLNATLMQPGKILVVCGPAASGKSVLAMALASHCRETDVRIVHEFDECDLKTAVSLARTSCKVIVCTRLTADHFTDQQFVTLTIGGAR